MTNEKPLSISILPNVDGKAEISLGSQYIELEDTTTGKFDTESLPAFISYLQDNYPKSHVFYNGLSLGAFENIAPKITDKSIASCALECSGIIKVLIGANDSKMDLNQFENFLRTARNYLTGADSIKLLDILENITIQKVKTCSRQQDNQGNYAITMTSEKGKNDHRFPKVVKFEVPLLRHSPAKSVFVFDFFFTWNDQPDGTVKMYFLLKNIDFDEQLDSEIAEYISGVLAKSKLNNKQGSFTITTGTNIWKYHKNEAVLR